MRQAERADGVLSDIGQMMIGSKAGITTELILDGNLPVGFHNLMKIAVVGKINCARYRAWTLG